MEVFTNPSETNPPAKATSLSISTQDFCLQNGNQVSKTNLLLFRVYCTPNNCFLSNNSEIEGNDISNKRSIYLQIIYKLIIQ